MTRKPFQRWHPGMADPSSRERAEIRATEDRAKLVHARIDSHGAEGLNDWLRDNAAWWGATDRSEAMGIIKKRLPVDVWRAAIEVML